MAAGALGNQAHRGLTACLAALLMAACAGGPSYRLYRPPDNDYSLEVPADWTIYSNLGVAGPTPMTYTYFVGAEQPQLGGQMIGPYIAVFKLPVIRGADQGAEEYIRDNIRPAESLFSVNTPGISTTTLGGLPGKLAVLMSDLKLTLSPARTGDVQVVTADVLVRRSDAFYLLEYRADSKRFPANLPAFDRARATFRFKS